MSVDDGTINDNDVSFSVGNIWFRTTGPSFAEAPEHVLYHPADKGVPLTIPLAALLYPATMPIEMALTHFLMPEMRCKP